MYGKTGEQHPNWKGICSDNKKHFTMKVDGKRYFLHRIIFAKALGMHPSQLPSELTVHHIDGDPSNNSLDNLVLCTNAGHHKLHRKWQELRHSNLWEKWKSTISELEESTPSLLKAGS
jgi:hypothetical protein